MKQLSGDLFESIMRFKKSCQFKHKHGFSANEILVIKYINASQPISSKDICAHFNFSKSFFSSILDSLEKKKMIEKQAAIYDKRILLISLSKRAKELMTQHNSVYLLKFEKVTAKLGEKDAKELIRLLNKMNIILEEIESENIF